MTLKTGPIATARNQPAARQELTGQVVYMYAFDVAYEMHRRPIETLLGHPVQQFVVDATKRSPKQLFFYRPQMLRLPAVERVGPHGLVKIERTVKILPVGAISILVSLPFSVQRIGDLIPYHDLKFGDGKFLYDEVRELAEQIRLELMPHLLRPLAQLPDEEAYTVFCIHAPMRDAQGGHVDAEDWLELHQRSVSSLLTEELDPTRLSHQESEESTSKNYSYCKDDLTVIDWDAALIIDDPKSFDEILYIMELANVQLAELEAYDRLLDEAVDRAYRDLTPRMRGLKFKRVQRELREIRIDLARLSDELSNITKFFGDWHLARIYQGLSSRFHLSDWHRIIDEKLKTLNDLYELMRADQMNRWMLSLEIAVVILFVLELGNSILHWAR